MLPTILVRGHELGGQGAVPVGVGRTGQGAGQGVGPHHVAEAGHQEFGGSGDEAVDQEDVGGGEGRGQAGHDRGRIDGGVGGDHQLPGQHALVQLAVSDQIPYRSHDVVTPGFGSQGRAQGQAGGLGRCRPCRLQLGHRLQGQVEHPIVTTTVGSGLIGRPAAGVVADGWDHGQPLAPAGGGAQGEAGHQEFPVGIGGEVEGGEGHRPGAGHVGWGGNQPRAAFTGLAVTDQGGQIGLGGSEPAGADQGQPADRPESGHDPSVTPPQQPRAGADGERIEPHPAVDGKVVDPDGVSDGSHKAQDNRHTGGRGEGVCR